MELCRVLEDLDDHGHRDTRKDFPSRLPRNLCTYSTLVVEYPYRFTMMCRTQCIHVLLLLLFLGSSSSFAFTSVSLVTPMPRTTTKWYAPMSTHSHSSRLKTMTVVSLSLKKQQRTEQDIRRYSGTSRGLVLMAMVLLLNIWIFSIPPEFRRQKLCPQEIYDNNNNNNCITAQMWTDQIVEYYRNGGGFHLDFSIDPTTLANNQKAIDTFFGRN